MAFSVSRSRTLIGLDIGSRTIKAAQLSGVSDGAAMPRLEAAVVLERTSPGECLTSAEAVRLRSVLARRGFKGRQVAVTVSGEALLTSVLELPPRHSDAPLAAIAAAEMGRTHRVEPETLEVAFWDLPASGGQGKKSGTPVMAAACRHEHADTLLDALEAPGFEVQAMDIEGWALCRAAMPLLKGQSPLAAAIDIGWRGMKFVLIHGSTVVYERMLGGTGIQALTEMIQHEGPLQQSVIDYLLARVGVADDRSCIDPEDSRLADKLRGPLDHHLEALIQELRLSVSYATHQYPNDTLSQLLLSGGGAMVRGLTDRVSMELEMPVQTLTPRCVCTVPTQGMDEGDQASLNVAVGMAMYPWKGAA